MKLITEMNEDVRLVTEDRDGKKTTISKVSLCKQSKRTEMVEFTHLRS